LKKSLLKKFENITNCRREGREGEEGRGGWRIVIPKNVVIIYWA
jgi:hypothetical protein